VSSSRTQAIVHSIRHEVVVGSILALVLTGGIGGWAALASLDNAVVAPATIVVAASRKAIQHETGGFISEINVTDGDRVKAGDVLIRLDGTQLAAEISGLEKRVFDYTVRRARLSAERDNQPDLNLSESLKAEAAADRELAEIIETQQQLLTSRLALRRSQHKQLNERVRQLGQEIEGLKQIQQAAVVELEYLDKELASLENLRKRQLVGLRRYNNLKRETSEKRGLLGRTDAEIASAKGRVKETELQIAALDVTSRNEILKELEAIEAELQQLNERLTAGRDQLWTGMTARVRFTAFNQRTTPELTGKIIRIASDQSGGEEGTAPFYSVRIKLSAEELKRLGEVEIKPGMPAEVLMTGQARTVISYLTKPIADQVHRAFRDD